MPRQIKRRVESDPDGKSAVSNGNTPAFHDAGNDVTITPNMAPEFPPVDVSTWGEAATDSYWTDPTSRAFGHFVCNISGKVVNLQSRQDQIANILSMNRMREMLGEKKRQEWISGIKNSPTLNTLSAEEKAALFALLDQDPEHVPQTLGSIAGVPGKSPYQMSDA